MYKLIYIFIVYFLSLTSAFSYVGPGMGGGLIAATLGIVIAIFASIFALLWFPLKRFLKKKGDNNLNQQDQENKEK